jgi:hypothetical protein
VRAARQRYEPAVPADRLREHPANPRRGDEDAISASMEAHGFVGAVVAQEGTGVIIAGNHRHRVAVRRGEATVPVVWLDVDDTEALRLLLDDNRSSDLGGYDDPTLLEVLAGLDGLVGTGYDPVDMEGLTSVLGPAGADGYDDPDPLAMAPRIDLAVPPDVHEAWVVMLAGYDGATDVDRLAAHLVDVGVLL